MKYLILMLTAVLLCGSGAYAGYDFVIEDGYGLMPNLHDNETLLMTGGGAGSRYMTDYSFARIEGTSALEQGVGGIWTLGVGGYSRLEFYGGEVHVLSIGSYGTAVLAGGRIDQIHSQQSAYTHAGWPDPHITIVSDLDSVNHDVQTNVLMGNWLDGSAFNIQLVDIDGYSPAIENIQFIPEPATLLLLVTGGLLLRRKRD